MPIADVFLQNIGLPFNDSPTYESAADTARRIHDGDITANFATKNTACPTPTSCAEDSPARTFPTPESAPESTASAADYGASMRESFANYDPATSSWRTSQRSFFEEWSEFSETWPRAGMTRSGKAYELPTLARRTDESESGLWPTPDTMRSTNGQRGTTAADRRTMGASPATIYRRMREDVSYTASLRGPTIFGNEPDGVLSQILADTECDGRRGVREVLRRREPEFPYAVKLHPTPQSRDYRSGSLQHWERQQGTRNLNDSIALEGNRWSTEPDVDRTLDGFSSWLDGFDLMISHQLLLVYAKTKKERPGEIVREMRHALDPQDDQRAHGGSRGISAETVLLAFLRQLEGRSREECPSLESAKVSEEELRGVRTSHESACPPLKRQAKRKLPREHANSLHSLSQVLARHAEKAWAAYRRTDAGTGFGWEQGYARVAHAIPARVGRLRGLGNAIVPQIAEYIGWQIWKFEVRSLKLDPIEPPTSNLQPPVSA